MEKVEMKVLNKFPQYIVKTQNTCKISLDKKFVMTHNVVSAMCLQKP